MRSALTVVFPGGFHPGRIAQGLERRAHHGQCIPESLWGLSVVCGCTKFLLAPLRNGGIGACPGHTAGPARQQGYVIIELQERDSTLKGVGGPAICLGTPGLAHSGHSLNFPELAS